VIRLASGVPLVAVERSGVVESVHSGHYVVLAPDGSVRTAFGRPDQPMFGRSCLKPLQAVGMLRAGLDADPADIALAAASHSGGAEHQRLIAAGLAASGLTDADLECPPDLPLGEEERRAYLAQGRPPSRLAMNCSGKHAAMLGTCLVNEWPVSGYVAAQHPLQRRLADAVADLSGETPAATGVDGCGAPVFAVTLTGLARAYRRIAASHEPDERRVADAMREFPLLVGGQGRSATRLMQGIPGLIAKDGAEGLFAAALPDGGAIAVKIDDGAPRAAERIAALALRQLGITAAVLDDLESLPVLGGGVPVGSVRPI
jgi:L-asparaginase II